MCKHSGYETLRVVELSSLRSVVGMAPMPSYMEGGDLGRVFVIEKFGVDISQLGDAGNLEEHDAISDAQ